jgi:myo-inositol-1(or 4)-monophosphatase
VAVLDRLHDDGVDFTLVSEELGERSFGGDGIRIVLDPIDGSMNAKRGIPFFAVSLAVADGPAMADVFFGYVFDFGTREEWTARRGEGAFLNDAPLDGPGPKETIEMLSFEATTTDLVAERIGEMVGLAKRTRVMGSLALSLCHLAAGRVDAVCSLKPARSVDIAAAQLLVRERGLSIDLPDAPPFAAAPLDLTPHSRVVAAATPARCQELYARLSASR